MSEYTILKKSQLWKLIPLAGRNRFSTTFGNKIYLTPKRYDDWKSGRPKKSTIALIAHEQVHVDQYRRDPGFKRRYVTSRKWRLRYEAEAYSRQIYERIKLGTNRSMCAYLDRYTDILASKTYMLFMPKEVIREAIEKQYKKWVAKLGCL